MVGIDLGVVVVGFGVVDVVVRVDLKGVVVGIGVVVVVVVEIVERMSGNKVEVWLSLVVKDLTVVVGKLFIVGKVKVDDPSVEDVKEEA